MVTKVLQNLSNQVKFLDDKKEPYMVHMNSFLEKNSSVLLSILQEFAVSLPFEFFFEVG